MSAELEKNFKRRGIKVHTGTKVTSAKAAAKGVDLEMPAADGARPARGQARRRRPAFDLLLVATGRGPVTEGLGAEALGLKMDRGYIVVDPLFRTNVPGISAIGDVITMGGPHYQLAHVSSMEGILLAERIAGQQVTPINYDHVPRCTYCDPEIGSVGLTEAQAKAKGYDVRTGVVPVQGAGPRAHGRRDRWLREDRGGEEVRRGARRAHHRPARHGAGRRGRAGPAAGVHGRGAGEDHPRAPDDVGGCR